MALIFFLKKRCISERGVGALIKVEKEHLSEGKGALITKEMGTSQI